MTDPTPAQAAGPPAQASPLLGRRALVTGAGVRLGRAIALACARAGANVAVHFHRSREAAGETAAQVRALGRAAALVQGDQAEEGAPERIAAEAAEALGGLDLLVLSAAGFARVPSRELDRARFEAMLAQDLVGPFLLARAAEPWLRAAGGCIVTILDVCGTSQVWPGYAHYTAAKAGLAAVTRLLAVEWAPQVRVNGVAPGFVLPPEGTTAAEREQRIGRIPLGREGSGEDVAAAVVFLASAPYVTGQILAVDGGRSVRP
jgi:pteridine reductase